MRLKSLIAAGLALWAAWGNAHARSPRPDAAAELQHMLDGLVARHPEVPGVLLAVDAPDLGLRWTGAAGGRRIGERGTLRPDVPFRIASVTKVYTAAAVLRLSEDRRLAIEGPIAGLLSPESVAALKAGGYDPDRITVRQLLSHTSGIFDYAESEPFREAVLKDPRKRWSRADEIAFAMAHGRPLGAPGERLAYSDTGYILLGEIVERFTGQPLAKALPMLDGFARIGATSTRLEDPDAPSVDRMHQYIGRIDTTGFDPSFDLYGGGGLVSTVGDMVRFIRPLLQGRLFHRPETLAAGLIVPPAKVEVGDEPHALLLRTRQFGRHRCWEHGGFWNLGVIFCPDVDLAMAYSLGQVETRAQYELFDEIAAAVERWTPKYAGLDGGATARLRRR